MKELYTTPELEMIGLAADENLASENGSSIDYDALQKNPVVGDAVKPSDNDIDVPLAGFNIGL